MKINIGSGDVKIDGFLNCDYDPNTYPDFLFDLEKDKFPFKDNTIEGVVAHHVFEHLGEGYFHCLQELYRVCKHGSLIDVRVPHYRHNDFFSDPTHRRPITVDGLRLFSKKYNKLSKLQGVYASRLGEFYNIDFEVIDWHPIPSEKYKNFFEGKTSEEIDLYLDHHVNLIEQLWISLIVVKNN
jgi:predicted SAM-dependent methyltransferase